MHIHNQARQVIQRNPIHNPVHHSLDLHPIYHSPVAVDVNPKVLDLLHTQQAGMVVKGYLHYALIFGEVNICF